ncbi:MAG: FAD-dependent oxidoreductase [Deltaproteobacteria bacterium]|nr:FAD-dependent oxidoreductase [Deltaproteobacteria bacterium]
MSPGGSPSAPERFDVVVVGAGTAGAAAAGMIAARGFRVALVEARARSAAGASWINDVPPWMFEAAGLALPESPEKHLGGRRMRMLGETDRTRLTLEERPMWGIDCRRLVQRLQEGAEAAGVTLLEGTRLEEVECEGERPVRVRLRRKGARGLARTLTLRAALFVDASGLAGALRERTPAIARACPSPPPSDRVSAAQQIRAITDREGAARFLERLGARPDEFLVWSGLHGGYSTQVVRIDPSFESIDLLTGMMVEVDPSGGPRSLEAFAAAHPWIGEPLLAGAAIIPVRRPYDRLGFPGAALIGEAGCQTFPAHGSGVGAGLIAARLLADALVGQSDPGDEAATWAYSAAFQRERGAVNAAYDVFRRTVQGLRGEEVRHLLEVGLMTPGTTRPALEQRMPLPRPFELPALVGGAARSPAAATLFGGALARMLATHALYRRYPEAPDRRALRSFGRRLGLVSGRRGDPV